MRVVQNLLALVPFIEQLCNITATPGASIGVLHHGELVFEHSFGHRDVENRLSPDSDTSYLIASMTKAITASLIGQFVDEGKLSFDTQLHQVLPDFERHDAAANITIDDLLSHRSGLPSYDSLWTGSDNAILLPRKAGPKLMSYAPLARPIRTEWLYNNVAYELLGQVLERISEQSYSTLLRRRIASPLGLTRTFYTDVAPDENTAKAYAALSNGSSVEIPIWGQGDILLGSAGGIRSSIADLLKLYKAFMDAANAETEPESYPSTLASTPSNPFRQVTALLKSRIAMPSPSLREMGYAAGWIRAQLPNTLAHFADYDPPLLGRNQPSRLMLNHQGYVAGSVGYVSLFPETCTAVVVLGNSAGLTHAMRLIGQSVIETVFENDAFNQTEYRSIARHAAAATVKRFAAMLDAILSSRTIQQAVRDPQAYTGRYYNSIRNFYIDVELQSNHVLTVSYMGSGRDTFVLRAYRPDQFFWWLDFDQSARRARLPGGDNALSTDRFIVKFAGLGKSGKMDRLIWKHESAVEGEGEVFTRTDAQLASQQQVIL